MGKLIVSSDSHIHDHKAFSDGVGRENSRLQQTLKVTRDTLEKARELGAVWVHGGDLIHTTGFSKHPITSAVIELFEEYPDVPKVMVWGNHDSRGRGGVVRIEDTFQYVLSKSVDNLHILDNSSVEIQGIKFYGCGAQPDRSLYTHEDADVGVYHDFIRGAKLPSGITLSDGIPQEDLYKHYRLSIVGDIHVPHLQEKDGRYIMIPGSPEAHTFGDVGERGWYIVDINDTIEVESVTSDSPLFITVEDASEIKQDGNFYKIVGTPPKDRLDNVKYVSSAPDVVESRNLLSIKDGIESMLQKWMEVTPPEGDDDNYLSTAKELVAEQDIIVPQNHKLLAVSGTNFCSYEEFSYNINDGVTLVVGAGDRYSSNGAGKSTAVGEAVYWCLFGKTTKGLGADDVIRWGEKKASVEVAILLSSGKILRIVRERTPTLKLSAFIDDEEVGGDTNRDLEAKILGLLGLNEKLFRSLAYFSQEDVVLLSRASDAEIKDIISDLAGLSGFQEASSAAAKKASDSENTIEKQKINLSNKKDELSRNKERLGEIDSNIEAFETAREANIAQYEKRLGELQVEASQVKERDLSGLQDKAERLIDRAKARSSDIFNRVYSEVLEKKTAQTEQELSKKEEELSEYGETEAASDLESAISEIEEKIGKCNSKDVEVSAAQSKVITEKNTLGYELKQIEKRLTKYDEGVCPECGQPLGSSSEDKTEELTKKKEELSQKITSLSDKEDKATEYLDKLSAKKQQLTESLNEKKSLLRRAQKRESLEKEITTLRETAEKANQSEAKIIATNKKESYEKERSVLIRDRTKRARSWLGTQVAKYDDLISRAEKQYEAELNKENPHVAYKEKIEKQITDLEKEQKKLAKGIKEITNQVSVYQYWNKGFGKSGIQSLLMDEIAGAFNSVRGKIFPVLTNGYYDVQLSTLSQTKAGELRERIAFLVFDQGQEVPYEALSGGQRRRVDLGVLLTMTAAVCQSYGIQGLLGILSLDEVTSYLDEDGAEALAQTLNEYVDFAVPSIYLISHDPNLQALFSQVMEVEMKDGVSRIK
jgi:DNA repair exonuclease SbcCD ATPase subunit